MFYAVFVLALGGSTLRRTYETWFLLASSPSSIQRISSGSVFKPLHFIFSFLWFEQRCTVTRPIKFIRCSIVFSLKICCDVSCALYRLVFVFATIIVQVQKLHRINNTNAMPSTL